VKQWADLKGKVKPEDVEPGVYLGMDFETYSLLPFVNSSKLKGFHEATPAHARAAILKDKETKPKALGHAIHLALLEPARFEMETLVCPRVDKRTKPGKAAWAEYESKAKGRTILTEDEKRIIDGIRSNVAEHETAKALLTNKGVNELTLVWDWTGLGEGQPIRCKNRLDRYTSLEGWPVIVDIKSLGFVASRHTWEREAVKFGYWFQAPFYRDGMDALMPLPEGTDGWRRFMWIVCETIEPYAVRVFEADDEPMQWGRDHYQRYMRMYARAKETGAWPSWDDGVELAGLPGWVYKTFPEGG
jgi:exodeoxyribonuclease VIII